MGTDKEYIHSFKLEGVEFTADSKRYFETLKPLLLEGPEWTFIRKFDKDNDGRRTIIALCAQAEGPNTKKIQISAVYHEILAARYRGGPPATSRSMTTSGSTLTLT